MNSSSQSDIERALHLFVVLTRAAHSVQAVTVADIVDRGLRLGEFEVLEALFHKGAMPQSAIASKVLITTGGITHVVDGLVERGLVIRRECESDRRVVYADITGEGRALMERIFPAHADVVRRAMAGLSEEEQDQAATLLKRLGLAARALAEESASGSRGQGAGRRRRPR